MKRCWATLVVGGFVGVTGCGIECPPGSVAVERRCLSPEAAAALDGGAEDGSVEDGGPDDAETTSSDGQTPASDGTVGGGDLPTLLGLSISAGELEPAFSPEVRSYTIDVPTWIATLRLLPSSSANVEATLQGQPVAEGEWSELVLLDDPTTVILLELKEGSSRSTYEITVTQREPITVRLTPSNDDADTDQFGDSVSLSGRGRLLAIGAFLDDGTQIDPSSNAQTNSGAVFVYERVGRSWNELSYIKSPEVSGSIAFGGAVALSFEGDMLAISELRPAGDRLCDSGCGVVRLFRRVDTEWIFTGTIVESDPVPNELFIRLTWSDDSSRIAATSNRDRTLAFVRTAAGWTLDTQVPGFGEMARTGNAIAARDGNSIQIVERSGDGWASVPSVPVPLVGSSTFSLSLSEDATTIAVGTSGENSGNGGVIAFQSHDGSWETTPLLSPVAGGLLGKKVRSFNQGASIVATAGGTGHLVTFAWTGRTWSPEESFLVEQHTRFGQVLAVSDVGTTVAIGTSEDTVSVRYLP